MKQNIFSIPFYQYRVQDWVNKKQQLLELYNSFDHKLNFNVLVSQSNVKTNILDDEIKLFVNEIGCDLFLSNFWFQKYHKSMNHSLHDHGPFGFSSVCFIEYDKKEHHPPVFYSFFKSYDKIFENEFSPNIEEGDIIFFPSSLPHYVPVNNSNKDRIVASFNLTTNPKKNNNISYL